jgi:hypothetical protein
MTDRYEDLLARADRAILDLPDAYLEPICVLIRELTAALRRVLEDDEARQELVAARFEELVSGLPGPFKDWLDGMVERARDDPDMQEGIRIVEEMRGHE